MGEAEKTLTARLFSGIKDGMRLLILYFIFVPCLFGGMNIVPSMGMGQKNVLIPLFLSHGGRWVRSGDWL